MLVTASATIRNRPLGGARMISQQIVKKLEAIGVDPVIPLPMCAQALGVSTATLKNFAKRRELEIIRVSDGRCGVRRSVFDRFNKSLGSAVAVTGKNAVRAR